MRKFEKIIQSDTEPNKDSLWLKDNKLYYFEGGWKELPIGAGNSATPAVPNNELLEQIIAGVGETVTQEQLNATIALASAFGESSLNDILYALTGDFLTNAGSGLVGLLARLLFTFNQAIDTSGAVFFENNSNMAINQKSLYYLSSPSNSVCNVLVVTSEETLLQALFCNAHLYIMKAGKLVVYNINTNSDNYGRLEQLKVVDLTLLPTYVDLELGNSDSIKAYNLEQLQKVTGTQFFVHADYGIGVGSFNSGHGGETTIQTAGGDRVHYIITAEGECRKQEDRFEHSELFYNLGPLDVTTLPKTITISDSVERAKFKKATNLAFEANSNGTFIDDVSMTQTSVNTITKQRLYTSPDIIYVEGQDWNYIKATATTYNDRVEIYLETI